jgi:GT2 family glycosyltransferase
MSANSIQVSVIVPVHNRPQELRECLSALVASSVCDTEIIVVDDASTDATASVAEGAGVKLMRLPKNSGPAAARNYGARHAQGDILFFVDADVVLAPGALDRVKRVFAEQPNLAAVFGSYDAKPQAQGTVSQYRNLLHHFVHQHSKPDACTFWAGCGAIRRSVFENMAGFDEKRFPHPSIEDIELGYRLREAGRRIILDKGLQVTHLKRWTLQSVVWTDIYRRAVPWARLILESNDAPYDLNLKMGQRLSGALVVLALLLMSVAVFRLELLALAAGMLLAVIVLNRNLYLFFYRERGAAFTSVCIPLHLLYYLYSALTYLCVWVGFRFRMTLPRLAVFKTKTTRSVQSGIAQSKHQL